MVQQRLDICLTKNLWTSGSDSCIIVLEVGTRASLNHTHTERKKMSNSLQRENGGEMNLPELWGKPAIEASRFSRLKKGNNRSPHRTEILNEEFISLLKIYFPPKIWSFEKEVCLPCSRGDTFQVDIVVRNKQNPKIIHVFLLKAIERSYNKNRHNYCNTVMGEATRLLAGDTKYSSCSFNWIDWVPNECPSPTTAKPSRLEAPKPCNQENEKRFIQNCLLTIGHQNCSITVSKIRYDLESPKHLRAGVVVGWEPLHENLEKVDA